MKIKVGIVGYGKLGQYLVDKIINEENIKNKFILCFVWNRSFDKLKNDKRLC